MTEMAEADRPPGITVGQPFLVGGAQRGRRACLKTHSNFEQEGHLPKFPVQCPFPFCFLPVIICCTNTATMEKKAEKKKAPAAPEPQLSPRSPTGPPFGEDLSVFCRVCRTFDVDILHFRLQPCLLPPQPCPLGGRLRLR